MISAEQRLGGRFDTTGNPFGHAAFAEWFARLGENPTLTEPFAGTGAIVRLMKAKGFTGSWSCYDITPRGAGIERRDTLADFPTAKAVITNPPYLSRHFARRKRLDIEQLPWGKHTNLYLVALERCLGSAEMVAAIIPESFVTSGELRRRLETVVSLTGEMFRDTEMPTCLALWGPEETSDFEVWRGHEWTGWYSELAREPEACEATRRIQINDPEGWVGLRGVDGSTGARAQFVTAEEIDVTRVNAAARLVSRVSVAGLDKALVGNVIEAANAHLEAWRGETRDVLLTAFKGRAKDGSYRRRLDYAHARALLALGIRDAERVAASGEAITVEADQGAR